MGTKTTTTTTEASAEDRQLVQGIGDGEGGDGGVSGSTTGPMDWQRQKSGDFPCYRVANSITVSYLSICCLVLIFFSSYSFFFAARNAISTEIMRKIFLVPSVH